MRKLLPNIQTKISDFVKYFFILNIFFTIPISSLTVTLLFQYYNHLIENAHENLLVRSKAFSFQLENSIKDRIYPSTQSPEFISLSQKPNSQNKPGSDLELIWENNYPIIQFTKNTDITTDIWKFKAGFIADKLLDSDFASPDEIVLILNKKNTEGLSDSIENNFQITNDMLSSLESNTQSNFFTILKEKGSGELVFSSGFPGLPFTLVILKSKSTIYDSIRYQLLNYLIVFVILVLFVTVVSFVISRSLSLRRKEESKFQSLIQNMPLGACLVNNDFEFIIQNKILEDTFSRDKNLWNRIIMEADFRLRSGSSEKNHYVWEIQTDKNWEVTFSPWFSDDAEPDGYSIVLRDLTAKKLLFEHEMELAKKIQEEYLPNDSETIKGLNYKVFYKPYFQVGGDYYDFIQLDKSRSLFVMADVIGHGMQAAMMMTVVKVLFLQIASTVDEPAEILTKMNTAIKENLPNGKSIVPFHFLLLNTEKRKFQYVNAGHPGMIYFENKSMPEYEIFERLNPVLGMPFPYTSNIKIIERDYSENTRFFLFTDGLMDVRNKDELFGIDNILEFVLGNRKKSPVEFTQGFHERILEFSAGEDFPDDITWFVIDSL